MKFELTVKFYVEADSMQDQHPSWTAEAAAIDFVSHRIDEGYQLEGHIFAWDFVSIESVEKFSHGVEDEWREHQDFIKELQSPLHD